MSDATAFGSGGTSPILIVGDPIANNNCNATGPSVDFTFDLPTSLQQCNGYTFDGYDNAVQPITITALIPGGQSLILHPPTGPTSYTWVADVSAGTTLVFVMTDSQGRQGGSSDLETVALSNNATCLSSNSPSSTASVPSSTVSTTSSTSAGASPTSNQSTSSSSNTATIASAAIGCVVALAALVSLGMFLLRKRRASRSPYVISSKRHSRRLPSTDLDHEGSQYGHVPPIYPFPYQADSVSHLAPPIHPATQSHLTPPTPSTDSFALSNPHTPFDQTMHSRQISNPDSFAGYEDVGSSSMSSAGRRKAALAGHTAYKPSTRFILHTDVEDVVPDDNGVVELPPQYSEHRRPLTKQPESVLRPISSHSDYSGPSDLAYASSAFVPPTLSHSPLPPPS
jgi:hypothetical protein